jgi:histidinol phosphatase-like enzyme
MTIYIDIDDTICKTSGTDYSEAVPIPEAIKKANLLYDDGHTIVYWTARGTVTGIDWRDLTESQFKSWGVKYHHLKFGKPAYDLFIDDKNISAKEWLEDNKKY